MKKVKQNFTSEPNILKEKIQVPFCTCFVWLRLLFECLLDLAFSMQLLTWLHVSDLSNFWNADLKNGCLQIDSLAFNNCFSCINVFQMTSPPCQKWCKGARIFFVTKAHNFVNFAPHDFVQNSATNVVWR